MSLRPLPSPVAVVVTVLLVATVAPLLGPSAATTSAATTGAAATPSASFGTNVVYEQRGDVANITIKTSSAATVNLGSPEDGFWMQVSVGSGTTKLRVNTYKAGESDSYPLSEMVWATSGSIKSQKLVTDSIDAPLDPAEYDMNVTIQNKEVAVGTLVVEERATHGLSARIAPRATDVTKISSEAAMREASVLPWEESVAHDDWLFLYVNASGLKGALSKRQLKADGLMSVTFQQADPDMNRDPNEFTGASVERVFTDGNTEGFYLAVDTGDHDIKPNEQYEITFTVPGSSPLADKRETVSETIRIAERRVKINRNGPGNTVIVEGKSKITGRTTLTPGTTINISARDTGIDPFVIPKTVRVKNDRTFAVSMDFSNLEPGREFEIRLPDQKRVLPAMVEQKTTTTTQTTTKTPTQTTTPETTTSPTTEKNGTSSPSDPGNTTTTESTAEGITQVEMGATEAALTQQGKRENASDSQSQSSGPVPGFGPLSGAIALLAAVVLAVRRL